MRRRLGATLNGMSRRVRRGLAVAVLGAGGAAVAALDWWAILVVVPSIAVAFALDPD